MTIALGTKIGQYEIVGWLGAGGMGVDGTKYRLLVAIEAAVSICLHVSSRRAARTPESYADCFDGLRDAAILSPDLAERLGRMARFRNRLVHVYWRIDSERLWTILQENLGDGG